MRVREFVCLQRWTVCIMPNNRSSHASLWGSRVQAHLGRQQCLPLDHVKCLRAINYYNFSFKDLGTYFWS
jgi:hypothetical protein